MLTLRPEVAEAPQLFIETDTTAVTLVAALSSVHSSVLSSASTAAVTTAAATRCVFRWTSRAYTVYTKGIVFRHT